MSPAYMELYPTLLGKDVLAGLNVGDRPEAVGT